MLDKENKEDKVVTKKPIRPRSPAVEVRYQEHLRRVRGPAKIGGR